MWAAVTGDDAGEATDRVAVYWVVDRTVADATVVHFADDGFESGDVLRWIAIEFDVGDVTGVTEIVVRSFDFDFLESGDWIIYRYVEGISVEFSVGDTIDFAEFFAIDLGEATSNTFGWGGEETEVEFVLLAVFVAFFAHVSNDV